MASMVDAGISVSDLAREMFVARSTCRQFFMDSSVLNMRTVIRIMLAIERLDGEFDSFEVKL